MVFLSKLYKNNGLIKGIELSLLWVPVFLMVFVNQRQFLDKKLYLPVARTAGYSNVEDLQFIDLVYFFKSSIVEFIFIIPIITILLSVFHYSKITRSAVLISTITILSVNFINLLSVANVGNLLSFNLMYSTAEWGLSNPAIITDYMSFSSLLKFLILLSAIFVIYYLSSRNKGILYQLFKYAAISYTLISVIVASGLLIYSQNARVAKMVPDDSFLVVQFNGLIEKQEFLTEIEELPNEAGELILSMRQKTNSQLSPEDMTFVGAAKNKNLLMFILETGPVETILSPSVKDLFPNLNLLKRQAFYSEKHYSTYPYTSDGLFSIFSSLYPDKIRRRIARETFELNDLGLLTALKNNNYRTNVYSIKDFAAEADKPLFDKLGAEQQYFAFDDDNRAELLSGENEVLKIPDFLEFIEDERMGLKRTYEYDVAALEKMLKDIEVTVGNDENFASVFLPQLGHGPWADLTSGDNELEDGVRLFAIQDKWIGYIIERLEELDILDETIIVVTSDHGLRTKLEYSSLTSSHINKISYNVPLLIYAPDVLSQTYQLPYVTSHIDIAPTVLSLMGVNWNKGCMIGSPVWDKNIINRITYFNGKEYFGNSGYYQDNKFVSYNFIQKRFYENNNMKFSQDNEVLGDVSELQYNLEYQQAFQNKIMQLIENNQFCNSSMQ